MSEKNFVAYGDAESILTGYANRIKQSPTTFVGTQAQWNALSSSQKAEYELVDITDDSLSPSGHVDWESNGEIGAKNLLPFDISHIIRINGGGTWNGLAYTYNGVTYTLLSDGTVRVNGTATAYSLFRIIDANSIFLNPSNDYYITGSPSSSTASTYYVYYSELINGSWVYYSNLGDEDTLFTPNITATQCVVDIVVRDGQIADNVIFKPMLRLATDSDSTYQPYAMTNKELTKQVAPIDDMNNILGAKNLLPNKATTQVVNGITYTVNEDGSITADGTATSDASLYLAGVQSLGLFNFKKGQYILSDGNNGYSNEIYMQIHKYESPYTSYGGTRNGAKTFTLSEDVNVVVRIFIANGVTVSNLTFKPMIRPASIKDDTYVPYVLTNRELTYMSLKQITTNGNFNPVSGMCRVERVGNLAILNIYGTLNTSSTGDVIIGAVPSECIPKRSYSVESAISSSYLVCTLATSGNIVLYIPMDLKNWTTCFQIIYSLM